MRFWRREEAADPDLHVVVGLGNPGAQYERTRHNVGFMVMSALARRQGLTFRGSRLRADVARGSLDGVPVLLAMPVTYMNDSGLAVRRLVDYYHVELPALLVVCDDIDLPFGTLRLRPDGSSGGNGGLRSIIQHLGTQNFARLRVGVGRPPGENARSHVLGRFSPEQEQKLPALVEIAADAVTAALQAGVRDAMNRFNRDWSSEL